MGQSMPYGSRTWTLCWMTTRSCAWLTVKRSSWLIPCTSSSRSRICWRHLLQQSVDVVWCTLNPNKLVGRCCSRHGSPHLLPTSRRNNIRSCFNPSTFFFCRRVLISLRVRTYVPCMSTRRNGLDWVVWGCSMRSFWSTEPSRRFSKI